MEKRSVGRCTHGATAKNKAIQWPQRATFMIALELVAWHTSPWECSQLQPGRHHVGVQDGHRLLCFIEQLQPSGMLDPRQRPSIEAAQRTRRSDLCHCEAETRCRLTT